MIGPCLPFQLNFLLLSLRCLELQTYETLLSFFFQFISFVTLAQVISSAFPFHSLASHCSLKTGQTSSPLETSPALSPRLCSHP